MGFTVDKRSHDQMMKELRVERPKAILLAVEQVGKEAVNLVTMLTGRTAPPVRAGEGRRKKHIGNWADITGNLARSIDSEVDVTGTTLTMTWGVIRKRGIRGTNIEDVVEYATYLDQRRGIKVLGGIEKIVEQKVIKAVQTILNEPIVS